MSDYDVPAGIDVLHVFCGPDGRHGNALGVVRDGRTYPDEASRQALAGQLGFSETVFVDDPERGHVDIYTPGLRLPFAGHPLVGAAWLLDLEILELPVGEIYARQDGEFSWIAARPEWVPPRTLEQYASVAEVEALTGPPPGEAWLYAWAWEDEAAGRVRARAFPRRIHERGVSRPGGAGACTGESSRTRRRVRRRCCSARNWAAPSTSDKGAALRSSPHPHRTARWKSGVASCWRNQACHRRCDVGGVNSSPSGD